MGGCGLIGEENIIKLNALGISLFVRPEEKNHSKTELSALDFCLQHSLNRPVINQNIQKFIVNCKYGLVD